MIKVGINEPYVIKDAQYTEANEKLSVKFSIAEAPKQGSSLFAEMAGSTTVTTGNNNQTISIWAPETPNPIAGDGTTKTPKALAKDAHERLGEVKNTYIQILGCFTTTDKIVFNPLQGLESIVTEATYESKVTDQNVMNAIFKNLSLQFIDQLTPFLDNADQPVRILLIRQSKTKHYPSIRKRWINDNPFIEPASVPISITRLKFTKREIEEGLNIGDITGKDEADPIPTSQLIEGELLSVFGDEPEHTESQEGPVTPTV